MKNTLNELQELSNYLTKKRKITSITIQFKEVRKGRARIKSRKITIPKGAERQGLEFLYYYLIHEVCHFICYDLNLGYNHDKGFKTIEQEELKEFNLIPIYAKAYPKELKNSNGMIVWKRK